MADSGCGDVDSVTNANGRWPLRASGMETTHDSAIEGCEVMACSMEPRTRSPINKSLVGNASRKGPHEQ